MNPEGPKTALEEIPPPLVAIGAWVVLVLVLHQFAACCIGPSTEDILRYLLLGLGLPALGLCWALWRPRPVRFWSSLLPWALAAVGLAAAVAGIRTMALPTSGVVAAVTAVAAAALALAWLQAALLAGFRQGWNRRSALASPGVAAAGFAGWAAALAALPQVASSPDLRSLQPLAVGAAILLTVLACWWGCGGARAPAPAPRWLAAPVDALAAVLIVALSFRTDGLFGAPGSKDDLYAHHHWSFIVGPAMLVRDGGWLLWDIPSQYGFLNTLLLAKAPGESVWQSLYVFNSVFTALMFGVVYLVLRSVRPGLPGQAFSLLTTVSLFFAIMDVAGVFQRHHTPSIGPFRFLWSFVLFGVLVGEARSTPGSASQRRWLLAGCAAWTVGVLWSFESAFYSSAVWLPGFAIAVIRDRAWVASPAGGRRLAPGKLAGWLLAPAILLAAALAAVCIWYAVGLGHLPDPRAFIDFALTYESGSVWSGRAEPKGLYFPVIVAVSAMFATIAVLVRRQGWPREIGVLAGASWMVWSWASYILSRKDSVGLVIALPALALGAGVFLLQLARKPEATPEPASDAFRAIVLPLLVLIPLGLLSRPQLVATTVGLLARPGSWNVANVEAGLPGHDPELAALLDAAGVKPEDPVVAATRMYSVIDAVSSSVPGATPSLIPSLPAGLIAVLPPERQEVYKERWAERHSQSGWVIQRKENGQLVPQFLDDTGPTFWEQLFRTHVPTRAYASEHWDLVWVEPAGPDRVRPELRDGRWMLDDRLVEAEIAGVSASWGPGALDKRGDGSAAIADGTVLNLYSDEARTVRLTLDGSVRRGYELAFEGSPAGLVDPPDRNGNMVELALPAGWSQLAFTAAPAEAGADPAARSRVSEIRLEPLPRSADRGGPARSGAQDAPKPAAGAATPEPDQQQKRDQEPDRPRRDRRDANGNQRATPALGS